MSKNSEKASLISSIYEWVEVICTALFTVVVLFTFVMRFVTVDGYSMFDTFHHGDRLIISDLLYEPKIGDVVVLQDEDNTHLQGPIIKRIIATEGDTVDLDADTWTVTVTHEDGTKTVLENEPYVNRYPVGSDGKITNNVEYEYMYVPDEETSVYYSNAVTEYPHKVEQGHVFVMGDNRNESLDSRYLGDFDERMILGKVYLRILPNPTFDFSK